MTIKELTTAEKLAQRQAWLNAMPGKFRPGEGNDNLCACTFQDVREYKNPYIGKTLRYRWCCILGELRKLYPQHFEELSVVFDDTDHTTKTMPKAWDNPDRPVPAHLAARGVK